MTDPRLPGEAGTYGDVAVESPGAANTFTGTTFPSSLHEESAAD